MNLNPTQPEGDAGGAEGNGRATVPALVITAEALPLRRRIGPLGWVVLEYLALRAQHTEGGWASPIGVRDMAGGIGVTKDTAARAVAALSVAGLVALDQFETPGGRRRSGYRLHLPDHMRRVDGLDLGSASGERRTPKPGATFTISEQSDALLGGEREEWL